MASPALSVIVPVRNGGQPLRRCLDALLGQRCGLEFEVIVVDDASTDASADEARARGFRVLRRQGQGGPGAARNEGAAAARAPVLVFCDADTVPRPHWLSRISATLERPDVVAVASGYDRSLTDEFAALWNHHELRWRRRGYGPTVDTAPAASLAMRREVFEAVGGFPTDLSYPSTEDMVLTLAVSRRGRLAWDSDNGVGHHFRPTLRGYLRTQWNYALPLVSTYRRHRGLLSARSHHPRRAWLAFAAAPALAAGIALGPLGWPLAGAGLGLSLAPELRFLRYVADAEGWGFAIRGAAVLPLRNLVWFAAATRGALS